MKTGKRYSVLRIISEPRISQARLAKELGVSQSTVSLIEQGIRDVTKLEEKRMLAALQRLTAK
jgi:DNA-binding XRE family transcriptional regulator